MTPALRFWGVTIRAGVATLAIAVCDRLAKPTTASSVTSFQTRRTPSRHASTCDCDRNGNRVGRSRTARHDVSIFILLARQAWFREPRFNLPGIGVMHLQDWHQIASRVAGNIL